MQLYRLIELIFFEIMKDQTGIKTQPPESVVILKDALPAELHVLVCGAG